MKGFPSVIQTRHDVDVLVTLFPEETKAYIASLIPDVYIWWATPIVGEGITDATHKVLVETREGKEVKSQFELRENLGCKLYQLEFTVAEAEEFIK